MKTVAELIYRLDRNALLAHRFEETCGLNNNENHFASPIFSSDFQTSAEASALLSRPLAGHGMLRSLGRVSDDTQTTPELCRAFVATEGLQIMQ